MFHVGRCVEDQSSQKGEEIIEVETKVSVSSSGRERSRTRAGRTRSLHTTALWSALDYRVGKGRGVTDL